MSDHPHAIIIHDWSGFCALLDQHAVEGPAAHPRLVKAQEQWQELVPPPTPAFPALLTRGAGFNALAYSHALERWLTTWGIAFRLHHPSTVEGLRPVTRALAAAA